MIRFLRGVGLSALAIAVVGCTTPAIDTIKKGEPYSLSAAQKQAVRQGVARNLKDPESARFGTFKASRDGGVITVCGSVNARNSFGGYTGHQPFAGVMINPGVFALADVGGDPDKSRAIVQVCNRAGIYI